MPNSNRPPAKPPPLKVQYLLPAHPFFLLRLIIDRIETVNCCHGALAARRGNNTPRSDAYTVALKPAQAVPLACTPPQLVCSGSSRRAGLCSWVWIWAIEPRTVDRCDLSCTILILIKTNNLFCAVGVEMFVNRFFL